MAIEQNQNQNKDNVIKELNVLKDKLQAINNKPIIWDSPTEKVKVEKVETNGNNNNLTNT